MATPDYAALKNLVFDRCQINVTLDPPVDDTTFARFINDALRDVWEISGGRMKIVPSSTAWTAANLCTGIVTGLLTDVADAIHIYATATAPAVFSTTTTTSTLLTSAALFVTNGIVAGMDVSRTGVAAGTRVAVVTDASNLTLTAAATTSAAASTTFSPTAGAIELDRVELSEIEWRRANTAGFPTYLAPKLYALTRIASPTGVAATVNLLQLDYWPGVAGYYFPMHYAGQFVEIDSAVVQVPDLNDTEARDGGLICAARLAALLNRTEFVPSILADVSMRTQEALARKLRAMLDARQDNANAA